MPLAGAVGGALVGGAINLFGARAQNRENARQAEISRQWSAYMSNTAVQRRMRDMQAAGINPILAGRYDASTPPSAMSHGMQNVGAAAVQGATSALQMRIQKKNMDLIDAQTEKTRAEAGKVRADTGRIGEMTRLTKYGADVASFGASLANIARNLIGNKTDAEISQFIRDQVNAAKSEILRNISAAESNSKSMMRKFEEIRDDIVKSVVDVLPGIGNNYDPGKIYQSRYEEYENKTRGRDISYREWLKRNYPNEHGGF